MHGWTGAGGGPPYAGGARTVAGPTTALPRPPGPWDRAVRRLWAERRVSLPAVVLAGVGATGVAAAVGLVGHPPGLGAALVALVAGVPVAWVLARRRAWRDLVTATLAVALVAGVAVRDAPWVLALALAAACGAGLVAVAGARTTRALLLAPVVAGIGAARGVPVVGGLVRRLAGGRRDTVLRVLRTVALTAVLLVVFGALFASADALFAAYLPQVDLGLLPVQLLVGLLVAFATLAAAHLALTPFAWPSTGAAPRVARLAEWLVPVAALDALVLAFLGVQVGGLVGGHAHVLATTGLTYAQYARAGFGQLVAVTALTLVVVAVTARRAPRTTARERLVTAAALAVLGVGTLGVVASALRRMALYVDAYGLTRLRVLVLVGEVVLGLILLLVLAAGLRWRAGWLPRAALDVTAVAVLALLVANPDATIVRYDAAADAPLDLDYLAGLSAADSLPAIDRLDEPLRSCLLGLQRERLDVDPSWIGWNAARSAAAGVLAGQGPGPADAAACVHALAVPRPSDLAGS